MLAQPMATLMPRRFLAVNAVLAVLLLSFGVALAAADSVAINGGATNVTSTSATLNGVVNTSDPRGVAWTFQYGTSTSYGSFAPRPAGTVGKGSSAVSAAISKLSPNTTYHFRLVAVEGSYESVAHSSSDMTFRTSSGGKPPPPRKPPPSSGTATLRGHSLLVHNGRLSIRLGCAGKKGARCNGLLTVRAAGPHGQSIRCAATNFSLTAGRPRTLHPRASSGCAALLAAAPQHRVSATLRATFSTHQASLQLPVTLHL